MPKEVSAATGQNGWVAMKGAQVVGELRTKRSDAEKDAEKLGEGAWVAPVLQ